MKNRLLKEGLFTTIIGFIILIFAGVMVYQEKASGSEMSGWIAVALLFLRSKDSILNLPKNNE